jgi:polysaccharide biosynthesis protein PslH
MIKVLIVCNNLPYPPHTGYAMFTYNIVIRLAGSCSFDLVYFESKGDSSNVAALKPYIGAIFPLQEEIHDEHSRVVRIIKNRFANIPSQVNAIRNNRLTQLLSGIGKGEKYHLVYFNSPELAWYAPLTFPNIATIIAPLDAQSRYLRETRKAGHKLLARIWSFEQETKTKKLEKAYYDYADACIVVSNRESEYLKSINPNANVEVIPLGVDERINTMPSTSDKKYDIVFSGNLSYAPNHYAALQLIKRILPELHKVNPSIRLGLIGRDPKRELIKVAIESPNTIVTGFVEDIYREIRSGKVYVCPVEYGTGMRIKILEAMALGMPIATFPVNIEDIPIVSGKHLFVAEDFSELVRRTLELLEDERLREVFAKEARELVLSSFSWDKTAAMMLKMFEDAIERSGKRIIN